MATTVDTLLVRIDAELGGLRTELARLDKTLADTQKKSETRLRKIGNAFKGLLGAVVIAQTARAGLAVVNFVSGIEEAQAKADVVFGSFAGQVREDLAAFAEEVGRSRFELEAMASSVQDTFVPLGFARGEASKLSVQLTKLATDVASFNNASDTETMEAFQSAIVGNHETVRRFGIIITEATLQQELYRMGINKSSQDATNAEKVQARLNLIMAGTTDAQGDAARTADSFANRSKALSAALQELAVTAVGPFMEDLASLVGYLTEVVRGMNGFLQSFEDIDSLDGYNRAIQETETRIASLRDTLKEANESTLAGFLLDEDKIKLDIDVLLLQLENYKKARAQFIKDQQASAKPDIEVKTPEAQTGKQADKARSAIDKLKEANASLRMEIAGVSEGRQKEIELLNSLNNLTPEQKQAIAELTVEYDLLKKESDEVAESQDKLADAMNLLKDSAGEELAEKIAALNLLMKENPELTGAAMAKIKELNQEFELQDPLLASMISSFEQAGQAISDSLADAFMKGELSLSSFRDISKQLISSIISNFLRLMVINPMINSMFGLTGGNALATGGGAVGSFLGFGSAGGGAISPSVPRVVGERGPELFVPNSAGRIMNNADSKSAMRSGPQVVVNQTLQVETGVSQTVRAEMASLMPVIKEQTINAVIESKVRGGAVSSVFGG